MPAGSSYWIAEGMLSRTIRNVDSDNDGEMDSVAFTVRNQFVHPNHPLGWIRKLTVTIDGRSAQPGDAFFVVRGQWVRVREMPTIRDIWWYMNEEAEIYVEGVVLGAGKHRVECSFEISMLIHAQMDPHSTIIDTEDLFPRLTARLSAEMEMR